jgi:hypothetical protein
MRSLNGISARRLKNENFHTYKILFDSSILSFSHNLVWVWNQQPHTPLNLGLDLTRFRYQSNQAVPIGVLFRAVVDAR